MVRKTELPGDADALRLGLNALKLDALLDLVKLDAVEHAEEIKMPPGAPELAVGREPKADFFLLLDDPLDLAVFNGLELCPRYLAAFAFGACVLQRLRAQEAAHVIGTEWRFCSHAALF
jgi:hypothetical protein